MMGGEGILCSVVLRKKNVLDGGACGTISSQLHTV